MHRSLGLALLSVTMFVGPAAEPAHGCVCYTPPMPLRLTSADEAFTGRIVSLRTAGGIDFLKVRVEQVLKGTQQSAGIVSIAITRSHSRPVPKAVGQRWVFFAYPNASPRTPRQPQPHLVTSDCAGSWRITPRQPAPDSVPMPTPPAWTGPSLPDPTYLMVASVIAASRP